MRSLNGRLIGTGIAIWACCGAVMGLAQSLTTTDNALLIHAAAAPVVGAGLSFAYYRATRSDRFVFTAGVLTVTPAALDFFVVATLLLRSYGMFGSLIGTWIPFALIFVSSYLTGKIAVGRGTGAALTAAV